MLNVSFVEAQAASVVGHKQTVGEKTVKVRCAAQSRQPTLTEGPPHGEAAKVKVRCNRELDGYGATRRMNMPFISQTNATCLLVGATTRL